MSVVTRGDPEIPGKQLDGAVSASEVAGSSYNSPDPTTQKWSAMQNQAAGSTGIFKLAGTGVTGLQGVTGTPTASPTSAGSSAGASGASVAKDDTWTQLAGGASPAPLSPEDLRKSSNFIKDCKDLVSLLQVALDLAEVILQVVNALQSDVKNWYKPLKVVAELLLQTIKDIMTSIASTGVYMLPIIPAGLGLEDLVAVTYNNTIKLGSGVPNPGVSFGQALTEVGTQLREAQSSSLDTLGEFKSVFKNAATSPEDPNRPLFPNEGDKVGGFIIFLDAQADVGELVHDIQMLLKLFGNLVDMDKLRLEAPKDVTAVAAMLPKDGVSDVVLDSDDWTADAARSLLSSSNVYPAIRVSWTSEKVPVPPITGWYVYRLTTPFPPIAYNEDGTIQYDYPSTTVPLRDYTDPLFNDGEPVFVSKKEYIDFHVAEGVTYFYWVAPATRYQGKLVPGSSYSNMAQATAINCIPDNQLTVLYDTPSGLQARPHPGSAPYWSNLTVRDLLGKQIDLLYKNIYESIQKLFATAETTTDQNSELIALLREKLAALQDVLDTTLQLIETIAALKFSANSMCLKLSIEKGGMAHFLDRVDKAKPPKEGIPTAAGNAGAKPAPATVKIEPAVKGIGDPGTFNYAAPLKSTSKPCSIYAAIVVMVGFPGLDTFKKLDVTSKDNPIRQAAITQSRAVVNTLTNDTDKVGAAVHNSVRNSVKVWNSSGELFDKVGTATSNRKDDIFGKKKSSSKPASSLGTNMWAGNDFRNGTTSSNGSPLTDADMYIQGEVQSASGTIKTPNASSDLGVTKSAGRDKATTSANTPSDGATIAQNPIMLARSGVEDPAPPPPEASAEAARKEEGLAAEQSKKSEKGSRKVTGPDEMQKKIMETIISIMGG